MKNATQVFFFPYFLSHFAPECSLRGGVVGQAVSRDVEPRRRRGQVGVGCCEELPLA